MKPTDYKKTLPILFLITFILGWAHYFIFLTVTRSLHESHSLRTAFAIFLTIGLFSIPCGMVVTFTPYKKKLQWFSWMAYIWLGLFNILFFTSIVEFVATRFKDHENSYRVFDLSLIIAVWALYKGLRAPKLVTHMMEGPAIMSGMTLVQVSDLHVGLLHLNAKWLSRVVEVVNQQNADIFAITGDLVEGAYEEVSPMLEVLKNSKARLEKFYITGNHEYIHGSGPWEKRLEQLGFTTLHNENKVVQFQQARILFAGVPDRMVPRFDPRLKSLPDVALRSTEKTDYRILLAHEPASRWDMKTETCDLILSGHTHGGQIFPFGLLVRLAQPVVAGFKHVGSVLVFAHQGTGLWGPPMRWFSQSEIVVFKWQSK